MRLSARERALLSQLFGQLDELLDGPQPGSAAAGSQQQEQDPLDALVGLASTPPERPSDPALARLLPDGYADDEAASEFRRYTESELRAGKREAADAALAGLRQSGDGPLCLDDESARTWLGALNDVRLVLGTRLGITEETYAELGRLPADDPRAGPLAAYDWLTHLQETLVRALARW